VKEPLAAWIFLLEKLLGTTGSVADRTVNMAIRWHTIGISLFAAIGTFLFV
jgi:HD superfamily phosphohydrolase YqeK